MYVRCLFQLLSFFSWLTVAAQEPKLMLPVGHNDIVTFAYFSPDGKKIITASDDYTAKIWDAVTGILLADLNKHTDLVTYAQFSPDGKKIVTASKDKTAKVWDVATGELVTDIRNPTWVISARFSVDGKRILTTSFDSTAKVWDAAMGTQLFSYPIKEVSVTNLKESLSVCQFSPDGKKIVTITRDSAAKIWDASNGNFLSELKNISVKVISVQFSNDGKKLITMAMDSTAKVWDAVSGNIVYSLKGIIDNYFITPFAAFSPDGKKIVTVSRDSTSTVKTWDASTGKLLADLIGHKSYVHSVQFSPDGNKIVTTGYNFVKIWDVSTGKLLADLIGHKSFVTSAQFSPDGNKIVTTSRDKTAKVWDVNSGVLLADLTRRTNHVNSQFSPDGKTILTASGNNAIIWDLTNGSQISVFKGHNSLIYSLQFSPDGKKIVTASFDSTVKVWNVASGSLMSVLKDIIVSYGDENFFEGLVWRGQTFNSAQFSPDGKKIITTTGDNAVKIWDAATGNHLNTLKSQSGWIYATQFSPDGGKIVTADDSTVKIWDAESSRLLIDFKGESGPVQFSPDGKKIVIAGDSTVKIWDAERGNLLANLKGHTAWGISAQFSKDGKRILTASSDSTAKVWDAETGSLLVDLSGNPYNVSIARFSPDEKKIITVSMPRRIYKGKIIRLYKAKSFEFNPSIRIWDAATGKLLNELKGHNTIWITSAYFSPDGKKIITSALDNTTKIWDTESGNLLYSFFTVDEDDYLVTDKDNHYDGTEAARKLLYFTCGTEVIELEQVKDQLWIPNLAERIMKGDSINAPRLSDLGICGLTPEVKEIDDNKGAYHFRIQPRRGGLGETVIYINGIEVRRYNKEQLKKNAGAYELLVKKEEVAVYFIPGQENPVTVKAWIADNTISSRGVIVTENKTRESIITPNLYAVMVGVSDYKGDELDLKYAAKDATDISNAIRTASGKLLNTDGKEHVFIYNLTTAADRYQLPEKNAIKKTLEEIGKKAGPNDILLIFFAGHGIMSGSDKKQFYFLTADASKSTAAEAPANGGISTAELTEWIKPSNIKAQKRILILDACNSGQAIRDFVQLGREDQGYIAARSDEKGQEIKAIEKLNNQSGLIILAASASDQNAYEMGRYSQGLLTYSLLKVMKQQPEILENGKYLDVSNWLNAARKMVSSLAGATGARQEPQLNTNNNFNIGVVDEEVRDKIILSAEKPLFARSNFQNNKTKLDNLKLRVALDKELISISSRNMNADITYSADYEGADAYSLTGDYEITGEAVTVTVLLVKAGSEIKHRYEVAGTVSDTGALVKEIAGTVLNWLKNNN